MTGKPKNMGELFKTSFEDFELKGDSSDWSVLEMKLEKMEFFRFNLTCFNIYYASLIALTFLFSSGVLIDYFLVSKEDPIQESRNKNNGLQKGVHEDSNKNAVVFSKDKTTVKQKKVPSGEKKSENSKLISSKESKNSKEDKAVLSSTSVLLADTLSVDTLKGEAPVEKKVQKKEPKKKIIYITKQDTLIVVDSIKTKSKKKK